MRASVQQSEHGLTVVIPSSVAEELRIQPNDDLEVTSVDGELVLKPISPRPVFEELVAKITEANRHPEVEWGPAMGNEVW